MYHAIALLAISRFSRLCVARKQAPRRRKLTPTSAFRNAQPTPAARLNPRPSRLTANWRWLHSINDTTDCYAGNTWDSSLCPDPATCATNCALDGADYTGTYGITSTGSALTLQFVTHGPNLHQRRLARVPYGQRQQLSDVQPEEPGVHLRCRRVQPSLWP